MGIWKQRIEGSWVRCSGNQRFSISNLSGSPKEKAAVAISLKHKSIDLALTGGANLNSPDLSSGFGNLSDFDSNNVNQQGYIYEGLGVSGGYASYIIDYFYDSITSTKKFLAKKNYQFKTHVLNYAKIEYAGAYSPAQGSNIFGGPGYTVRQSNGNVYYSSMNIFRGALGINPTWEDPHYFDVPYYKGTGVGGVGSRDTGLYNPSSAKMPSMYTLYYYSSPKSDVDSGFVSYTNRLKPSSEFAIKSGTQSVLQAGYGITGVEINEIGWKLQGYSFVSYDNKPDLGINGAGPTNSYSYWTSGSTPRPVRTPLKYCTMGKGWYYDEDNNEYTWYDKFFNDPVLDSKNNPVGGETGLQDTNVGYRENNYIAKYIPFQKFNLSFLYENLRTDAGIKVYLSPTLPTSKPTESSKYIGQLKYPSKYIPSSVFATAKNGGVKFSLVSTKAQEAYPLPMVSNTYYPFTKADGDIYAPVRPASVLTQAEINDIKYQYPPYMWPTIQGYYNTQNSQASAQNSLYPVSPGSTSSTVIQDYPAQPLVNTIFVEDDSTNLKEVRVNITMRHTYIADLIINLKVPNGNVINIKAKYSGSFFNDLRDITFTTNTDVFRMKDYSGANIDWWPKGSSQGYVEDPIGIGTQAQTAYPVKAPWLPAPYNQPYNFNWAQLRIRPGLTFQMDKQNGQGAILGDSSYRSNVNDLKYLSNPDGRFNGTYSLYIKDDWGGDSGMLESWSIEFIYKKNFVPILSLTQSDPESTTNKGGAKMQYLFGLEGNQWLFIRGDKLDNLKDPGYAAQSSTDLADLTHLRSSLKNLKIDGGYHEANNKLYAVNDKVYGKASSGPQSAADSGSEFNFSSDGSGGKNNFELMSPIGNLGFNSYVGSGNINEPSKLSLSSVVAKIGNGTFRSGIWENGAWNSGWRSDETMKEFYAIGDFVNYALGKKWRFSIFGPAESASSFEPGDKVSIGNLAAIDINDERRLIKSYFTIIAKGTDYITVELESDFPIRRIKADSEIHRISVTKNVWLGGGFFNGMFKGVWNSGLFQGFPFITEMKDSHWIEGKMIGGHFTSSKKKLEFSNTFLATVVPTYSPILGILSNLIKVGLIFRKPHGLAIGDSIFVSSGQAFFGKTTVMKVETDYRLVTDINWEDSKKGATGSILTNISTGLIQNIEIDTRNTSTTTSLQSMDSSRVFMFDTWIDVNFDKQSAVNIGKPQSTIDISISSFSYSDNNLYGYPTYDVLCSDVFFRDSFSNTIRKYKLGSKYKIFDDYIGAAGDFDEHFDATGWATKFKIYKTRKFPFFATQTIGSALPLSEEFDSQGWVLNRISATGSAINAERTVETQDEDGVEAGKEMKIEAIGRGGVLDIKPAYEVSGRNNSPISKQRYTMVKFDLLSAQVPDFVFEEPDRLKFDQSSAYQPIVHFNNLNLVSRRQFVQSVGAYVEKRLDATYLPVYKNINHVTTASKTKTEFFYNKRNLSMFFRGNGLEGENISSLIIDNLRLYEVDMIPFFQYFTEANINKSVSVPYQAVAPVIAYTDASIISENPIYSPDSLSVSQPSGEVTVQSESAAAAATFASKSTEMDNAGGGTMVPASIANSAFNPDTSSAASE